MADDDSDNSDKDNNNNNNEGYNDVPRGPLIRPFAQIRSPERNKRVIEIEIIEDDDDSTSDDDDDDDDDENEIPIAAFSPQKSSTRVKMMARKGTQRTLHFPKQQQVPSRKQQQQQQPNPPLISESSTTRSTEDSTQRRRQHLIGASSSSSLRKSPPQTEDSRSNDHLARTRTTMQGESSQPRDIFRQALADGSNVDVRNISSDSCVARPQPLKVHEQPVAAAAASVVAALANETVPERSKATDRSIPASHVQPQLSSTTPPPPPQGNSSLAHRGFDLAGGLLLSKATATATATTGSTILHSPPEDRESNQEGGSSNKQMDCEYQMSSQGVVLKREGQDKSQSSSQTRAPTMVPSVQTHPSCPQLAASRSSSSEAQTALGASSKEAQTGRNSTNMDMGGSALIPPPPPANVTTMPKVSNTSHESTRVADLPDVYTPEESAPSSSQSTIGEAVKARRLKRTREPTSRLTIDKFDTQKYGADDKDDYSSPAEAAAVSFRAEEESTASAPSETSSADLSELTSMTMIPHLSKTTICKITGLPIQHFCVHGFPDGKFLKILLAAHLYISSLENLTFLLPPLDYVYDFKIEARPSNIPNAGMGAFLTFIGARRLQQKTRIRATELLDARPYKELTTMRPLVAELPDGFGMGVTLTGAHLHGPYNSTYLLPALKAVNPDTGRKMKVRLANSQDVSYYPDELDALKNPNKDGRFGFLGIHHEDHYRCDTKKTFASAQEGCGLIDIGRYGPFRREGTPH